jgi:hypothetical protein
MRASSWQHLLCDRFVRQAREFREQLEYIHTNLVRKGSIEKPEQ